MWFHRNTETGDERCDGATLHQEQSHAEAQRLLQPW